MSIIYGGIGTYYGQFPLVGKVGQFATKEFFTVADGSDVYVYQRPSGQRPSGQSTKDVRKAVSVAFINNSDSILEYKLVGRYPNYQIEEIEE